MERLATLPQDSRLRSSARSPSPPASPTDHDGTRDAADRPAHNYRFLKMHSHYPHPIATPADDPHSPHSPYPHTPSTPSHQQHYFHQQYQSHQPQQQQQQQQQQQPQPLQQYGQHYAKMPLPTGYHHQQSQLPALHISPNSSQSANHNQHSPVHPHPSASASKPGPSGVKRKRKSIGERAAQHVDDDDEPTGDAQRGQQSEGGKKRTKTQRACDSCRTRKIRCDILGDTEPSLCHHCKQYGFECTFFLPITETRFKKKRVEEDLAPQPTPRDEPPTQLAMTIRRSTTPRAEQVTTPGEAKVYGPTAIPFIMHSTASVPKGALNTYDLRNNHRWEISASGDGFIHVTDPGSGDVNIPRPTPAMVHQQVREDVLGKLVTDYFTNISPLFPVISRHDFLNLKPNPPPLLLYSICIVAAARRDTPREVFDALRAAVNRCIREDDVLSTSSTASVQALLVLGMCGDAHGTYAPLAVTALWQRVGAAIRQAQDLGLQRAEAITTNIEVRRRVWGACVVSDRWCSLTYGQPFMIDVQDCDARLPSAADSPTPLLPAEYMYMCELIKLSILLGRVLKLIYSPSGLTTASDDGLQTLLADLDLWKARLPAPLVFNATGEAAGDAGAHAGLLHLLYSCVLMIFWRVFMRISYSCPAHLKFSLSVERWTALVHLSRDSIDWLDAHEWMLDAWTLVGYAATSCALVQFHTWTRRRDPEAQASLHKLHECVRRWEEKVGEDHMPVRKRTSEVISLLYKLTLKPVSEHGAPGQREDGELNPTRGVMARAPESLRGLTFHKDASRVGGGVYVAPDSQTAPSIVKDLPEGTFISRADKAKSDASTPAESTSSGPSNVNPDLNGAVQNVQVLNILQSMDGDAQPDRVTVSEHGFLEVQGMGVPQNLGWEGLSFDNFFANGMFTGLANLSDPSTGLTQFGDPAIVGLHQQQQRQQDGMYMASNALQPSGVMSTMAGTTGPPPGMGYPGVYAPGTHSHVGVNGHDGRR